jgi:hypothetical protein
MFVGVVKLAGLGCLDRELGLNTLTSTDSDYHEWSNEFRMA